MKTQRAFLCCAVLLGGCDKTTPTDATAAKPAEKAAPKAAPTPDAKPDTAPTPATAASFTCDAVEKHKHCSTATPIPGLEDGLKAGCEVGSGGVWSPGEHCPKEKVVATCKKEMHAEVKYFYEGTKLDLTEKACTSFSGTWTLGS